MTNRAKELSDRITEYLSLGGLFNPELMEHDKVRDLLIDIRNYLKLDTTEWTENYGQGSEPWLEDDKK